MNTLLGDQGTGRGSNQVVQDAVQICQICQTWWFVGVAWMLCMIGNENLPSVKSSAKDLLAS